MRSLKMNKMVTIVLTLVLLMSSFSFAANEFSNEKNKNNRCKLLPIVEKYSPETLEEWTSVLKERKELRENLVKLNKSKKTLVDSGNKDLKKKKHDYINELRNKVERGEMTKEEAKEEFKQFKMKDKGKKDSNYDKIKHEYIQMKKDLIEAVSQDDGEKAKLLLDQLYVKYKESNEAMESKLRN